MRNPKQTLIWLKRFRNRCGYGVHSPFAFNFITNVIYEKAMYYAYSEIEKAESGRSTKVNRLLFRLVNSVQPLTILHAGKSGMAALYLQAAKKTARYIPLASEDVSHLLPLQQVDFLYIDRPENVALVRQLYECGVSQTGHRSMIVIGGIYRSTAMKTFWKQAVADQRVGITFDLYDLGILFFDRSKIKQHYVVNF
jgi:hypothetical protein